MKSLLLAAVASLFGCSTAAPPGPCVAYQVPVGTDLSQPTLSFQKDVIPILQTNCAKSACHGSSLGKNNGVYLGTPEGPVDASRVHGALVNVTSPTAPALQFVTPSDPDKSFLLRKVDGDLCMIEAQCGRNCGLSMPKEAPPLDVASRDVIRRWIAQGATNN